MSLKFQEELKEGMILTGGHFTLTADGSSINRGTIDSFEYPARLYAEAKKRFSSVALGILINDIGAVCSSDGCSIQKPVVGREQFEYPEPYLELLDELDIKRDEVIIFWEKHIRNRSKKLLHSRVASSPNSIRYIEKQGYVYDDGNTEMILTRYNTQDPTGTPACPLIMSAYAIEKRRRGYSSSLNFYYVGADNYMNVANHFVIEKGRYLASQFEPTLGTIKNVYLFENQTMMKNF